MLVDDGTWWKPDGDLNSHTVGSVSLQMLAHRCIWTAKNKHSTFASSRLATMTPPTDVSRQGEARRGEATVNRL